MFEREKLVSTYLGESIAVPHGTVDAKDRVIKTGIVICQYPQGVAFSEDSGDVAKLVIGIAAKMMNIFKSLPPLPMPSMTQMLSINSPPPRM